MTVSEKFDPASGFPTLGGWTLTMKNGSQSLLGNHVNPAADYLGFGAPENWKYDTLVITPSPMGPIDATTAYANAIYQGRIVDFVPPKQGGSWTIGGESVLAWLGNDDSPSAGPGIRQNGWPDGGAVPGPGGTYDPYTNTLAVYLAVLFASPVNGFTYSTSGSLSANALNVRISQFDCYRDRINKLLGITTVPTEYRVKYSTRELMFAEQGSTYAYRQTPQVFVGPDMPITREGTRAGYTATVDVKKVSYRNEVGDGYFTTSGYNAGGTTTGQSIGAVAARNVYGPDGNAAAIGKTIVDEDAAARGGAHTNAADRILRANYDRMIDLDVTIPNSHARQDINCGDYIAVEDPDQWIQNTANGQLMGGRERFPVYLRSTSLDWGITREHGVYVVHSHDASMSVTDLRGEFVPDESFLRIGVAKNKPVNVRTLAKGTAQANSWNQGR